jgi:hypothetical protein
VSDPSREYERRDTVAGLGVGLVNVSAGHAREHRGSGRRLASCSDPFECTAQASLLNSVRNGSL